MVVETEGADSKEVVPPAVIDVAKSPPKSLHKAASMNLSGHGQGLGLTTVGESSTSGGGAGGEQGLGVVDREYLGRPPRSADPSSAAHPYKPSLGRKPTGKKRTKEISSLPLPDVDRESLATIPSDGSLDSPSGEVNSPRPRATTLTDGSVSQPLQKSKSNVPPPRPPPLRRRRRSSEAVADWHGLHDRPSELLSSSPRIATLEPPPHPDNPLRTNSMSEIAHSGVDSDERVLANAVLAEPRALRPIVNREDSGSSMNLEIVRRSAPATPPPSQQQQLLQQKAAPKPKARRKAPPVPVGGRRTGTLPPASSGGIGLEVPVGRWAVPS